MLIEAVSRSAGVAPEQVACEHTPSSRVFVAGELAFKFKRRVDLGFLDHRSLESRRRACEEEVTLNARLAPEVYLGIAAVRSVHAGDAHQSALHIDWPRAAGAAGESPAATDDSVLDWCVVMRALPPERMLADMLERSAVDESVAVDIELLMKRVAEFHRTAQRGPEVAACRSPDRVRSQLRQTLAHLESTTSCSVPSPAPVTESSAKRITAAVDRTIVSFLRARAEAMFEHALPLLEARRARGCIVDGHGDLHTRNICMVPGAPVAYDCLEFSRELRCRDTSGEIAFLAMDLEAHGRADLAARVVRAYLDAARRDPIERERERDFGAVQPWLRMSDALVRAMVETLRGDSGPRLHRYLDLACGYALEPSAVLLCGVPGSGKSTLAKAIAVPLRATVLRSDVIRKELAGLAPTDRGSPSLYHDEITERVYRTIIDRAVAALRNGQHVVFDAAFPTRALREMVVAALSSTTHRTARITGSKPPVGPALDTLLTRPAPNSPFTDRAWVLVESVVPDEELQRRLRERVEDPREVSDAGVREMREMAERFEPPVEISLQQRLRIEWAPERSGSFEPPSTQHSASTSAVINAAHAVVARLVTLTERLVQPLP